MKSYHIGFSLLVSFCFFRPLAFIETNIEIGGLSAFELFAIIFSYLLIVGIALNFRNVKLDSISIFILLFCYYCIISIFWGSKFRTVLQVILPFVLFFAVRVIIKEPKQIKLLLTVIIVAYCFPLVGSAFQIIKGSSVGYVESITGIERYVGMFKKIHMFSYAMFFFSIFFYMQTVIHRLKNGLQKSTLIFLLIISFFCLFNTYSRNAYIGVLVFWIISLWGYKRKYFFIVLVSTLVVVILYIATFKLIFFKAQEFEPNTATSGRIFLWEHNIKIFLESSFDKKLLGHGLGVGSARVIGSSSEIWSSHNNYLHLLLEIGFIGLILYIIIYALLLKDIYIANIDKKIKFFYYGTIVSIALMNFTGDVNVYGVAISQIFWMVMGFFYLYKDYCTSYASSSNFISKRLTEPA